MPVDHRDLIALRKTDPAFRAEVAERLKVSKVF